jgi:hypothetical protein
MCVVFIWSCPHLHCDLYVQDALAKTIRWQRELEGPCRAVESALVLIERDERSVHHNAN